MSRYGRTRSVVKRWRSLLCRRFYMYIYSREGGGAEAGQCGREKPPGI